MEAAGAPYEREFREYSVLNQVRELSVEMNLFTELYQKTMNPKRTASGTDVCSEEKRKMAWMQEAKTRIFMQVELKACRDELDWLIICHNCAADNCPEKEYLPRPLPILPDYIDNLQRRLGKVMKRILPPPLKMIFNTYYQALVRLEQHEDSSCPHEEQLKTSREVQPDDMTGKHRDEEYNPLERPPVLENKEKLVADGTSPADQGGYFVFQTEVGMNLEISQVAACHFKMAMF